MAKPLLSIVILARDSALLRLQHAIDSALQQTYEPKTVYVVNANPSDQAFTLGLLENLKRYPQLTLLPVAGQGTEFYFRNRALERIDGGYVAFMSDRDGLEPGKVLHQAERIEANPSACAAFTNILELRETPDGIVGSALFESAANDPQVWMLEKTISYGSQVLYCADALKAVGGFDERLILYGDLDVLVRLAETQEVLFCDQLPVRVHVPPLQDLCARQLADNRYLFAKHTDFFLLHKKTAFDFCLLLARQALENRRFQMMVLYLLRAVLKQPIRAALLLVRRIFSWLWTGLSQGARRHFIHMAVARLRTALLFARERREPRPILMGRRKRATALDHLQEHEFVRFSQMQFMRNQTLEYVKIPDYVTVIPLGMFFDCKKLHTVEIPATVTRIEANAFQGCERLKTVRIAHGSVLETIGAYAFAGCVSLASLELSPSLVALGKGAFAGCVNLQGLSFLSMCDPGGNAETGFPSSLRALPPYAFAGCAALKRVAFEPGSMLETLGKRAFLRCGQLELLRITGTVQTIGAYAMAGCTGLTFLDMMTIDSIRVIGRHAFQNCRSLASLYLPHALKTIRAYTYNGCASLQRVKIPPGVKRIGRHAFAGCDNLETVTLMDETTAYFPSSFPRKAKIIPYKPVQPR